MANMTAIPSSTTNDSKLIIVALEGCHGCGKTALCAEFEAQGYSVLDEAFMDMPSYALHPQSLLMETAWVCSWFERVLRLAATVQSGETAAQRQQVFIADRSPFSAVLYAANGHLLEPLIRAQIAEVEAHARVQFYTVHVAVERELLWSRICERLMREPERIRFNEHKRAWMDTTLGFYNRFEWDVTVTTTDARRSIATIVDAIRALLQAKDATFAAVAARTKSLSSRASSVASTDSSDNESCHADEDEAAEDDEAEDAIVQAPVHVLRSIIAFNNCDF